MATDDKTETISLSPQDRLATTQECFRLLDLPLELVVRVLGFAVLSKEDEQLQRRGEYLESVEYSTRFECWQQPAITQTCHLLRDEGLPLFYGCNQLHTTGSDTDAKMLWTWARTLPAHHMQMVNSVRVLLSSAAGTPWHVSGTIFDIFIDEMAFQRKEIGSMKYLKDKDERQAFVRMAEGRVKMSLREAPEGQMVFYEMSFADHAAAGDDWRDIRSFPVYHSDPATIFKEELRAIYFEEDWWVEEPKQT